MDTRAAGLIRDPAAFLEDPDPAMRRIAVATAGVAPERIAAVLGSDPEAWVRAAAAESLGASGAVETLLAAVDDPDPVVLEAVAFALGEADDPAAVPWLLETAAGDGDKLVREAAVASLGALGDDRAVPRLLELVASAPPQIRRRAVVALTAFDGAEVEAAIRAAARDRNPMVREAAEMVVGPQLDPADLLRRC